MDPSYSLHFPSFPPLALVLELLLGPFSADSSAAGDEAEEIVVTLDPPW
jgi:hypothetical protein